ncbi:MAG: ABC transporter ATP-binding protein [Ardenticatenaceae bacterium]|nr:ABC transporter ATP-binding protein [Ardenticatenaceae bacterium]MCB9443706.1 ABC transporter ATP-binding protein [Ardenticatenaceae bacterium]
MVVESKKHPMVRLLQYARQFRNSIVIASVYSILNKVFDLAPPALIGAAVDVVVAQQDSFIARLGIRDVGAQLWALAVATVIIWGFESLFQYLYSLKWRYLAQDLQHELRLDAYAHVQDLELAYFEDRSTGGLMAILNDDINQLERFFDVGANDIWQVTTTVLVIGAIFVALAPTVSWMALLPMPFVIWGSVRFQKRLAPRYAAVREQVSMLSSQLANNLGGIATIKSFTAEAHENGRIRHESQIYKERNQSAIVVSSAFVPLIRMIIVIAFTTILVFGGQLAIRGSLNIGAYSVLVFLTQRLLWPLTNLGNTLDLYQRAMASTTRVLDVLDTQPQILDGLQTLPVQSVRGEVTFEDVSFEYQSTITGNQAAELAEARPPQPVIHNLSFRVPAGDTAAFVGATGAGKSTVVKLILRFYDVQNGRVCLDGHDIRALKMDDLRRSIGFVSQDVFLFHGTVRENITYGSFDSTMDEIIEAAKIAEAHDFIMELPDGYDTIVGERGQKLSGGQRQRISIARAVLKDPPVLILDEATSAVDNETEAAIQRSMERITVGRTTIVIAHRLSTVRNADRIFVLDKGRLSEQGRHEALVASGGIYAALWRVQTGERVAG